MGGRKPDLNKLAREIWKWCEERGLWVSAFFIPGIDNLRADSLSCAGKKLNEDMEWGLDQSVFVEIQVGMGPCNIDLFASSQNDKLPLYASNKPDKSAYAINAFSLNWNTGLNYAFPPFSCISRIIQKVIEEEADLILVAPLFPTQTWFPHVL